MHGDDNSRVREEFAGMCCFFWPHREVASDWQHQVSWFVELVDQLHIEEDTRVTSVIDCHIWVSSKPNHKPSSRASIKDIALMHSTRGAMIC